MIVFNNLCLREVEVSFYQVARSWTIVFNIALSSIFLRLHTSNGALLCCAIVIAGYLFGLDGEQKNFAITTHTHDSYQFSSLGVGFGLLSSAFVALNAIATKKTLPKVDNNAWKLLMYNNINGVILMPACVLFFDEIPAVRSSAAWAMPAFWWTLALSGVFGFLIGFASYAQIKATSPLTHNVSGTAKACAQTVLSLLVWPHTMTSAAWAGTLMVIGGSAAYGWVRYKEMAGKQVNEKK